jgi:hypothetical protein
MFNRWHLQLVKDGQYLVEVEVEVDTSLCSYSMVLLAEKQQIPIKYSLWFDPTEARTHDLPHSRWAR